MPPNLTSPTVPPTYPAQPFSLNSPCSSPRPFTPPPPRCRVQVLHVTGRPEYHGRSGCIVAVQGERYVVELPSVGTAQNRIEDGLCSSERVSLRIGSVAAC